MLMGFILHFYIILGTNLLTGGPAQIAVFFAYFSVSQKKNIKRVQTKWNLRERDFWNKRDPEDLEWTSSNQGGGHEVGGAPTPWVRPPPRGPLVAQPTYFFLLHISIHPENIQEHHETLFPLPQPYVPKRSHLGTFSALRRKGHWSWRASTSTPRPLQWCE